MTSRPRNNAVLLVGMAVFAVLAVVVAIVFDSPTSVWILAAIAVAGGAMSLVYGMRADRPRRGARPSTVEGASQMTPSPHTFGAVPL